MKPILAPLALMLGVAVWAPSALSQDSAAQQRYERQVAACNSANLSAPERRGCIRAAGSALDNARGGPAPQAPMATPDGRATVVMPSGAPMPASGAELTTTPDGRATVVPPSDRSTPR